LPRRRCHANARKAFDGLLPLPDVGFGIDEGINEFGLVLGGRDVGVGVGVGVDTGVEVMDVLDVDVAVDVAAAVGEMVRTEVEEEEEELVVFLLAVGAPGELGVDASLNGVVALDAARLPRVDGDVAATSPSGSASPSITAMFRVYSLYFISSNCA